MIGHIDKLNQNNQYQIYSRKTIKLYQGTKILHWLSRKNHQIIYRKKKIYIYIIWLCKSYTLCQKTILWYILNSHGGYYELIIYLIKLPFKDKSSNHKHVRILSSLVLFTESTRWEASDNQNKLSEVVYVIDNTIKIDQ